jgi:hypothetical protein
MFLVLAELFLFFGDRDQKPWLARTDRGVSSGRDGARGMSGDVDLTEGDVVQSHAKDRWGLRSRKGVVAFIPTSSVTFGVQCSPGPPLYLAI